MLTPFHVMLADILTSGDPPDLPAFLVQDVKRGRDPVPTGVIRVWAKRGGTWKRTEAVDASAVDWGRLLDNDRIEVVS